MVKNNIFYFIIICEYLNIVLTICYLFIFRLERDLRYSKWKMAIERSMKWDSATTLMND